MDSVLWSFGSLLFVIAVICFVPIGLTKKGKSLVVVAGFLLALTGRTAAVTFSLWQTMLILVILVFLVAFLLDRLLGSLLYVNNELLEQEFHVIDNSSLLTSKMESSSNQENIVFSKDDIFKESSYRIQEKEQNPEVITHTEINSEPKAEVIEPFPISMEEDISFLLERSAAIEGEIEMDIPEIEKGYLSEIEDLLADHSSEMDSNEETKSSEIQEPFDEDEIPILELNDKLSNEKEEYDLNAINLLEDLEELPILTFQDKGGK